MSELNATPPSAQTCAQEEPRQGGLVELSAAELRQVAGGGFILSEVIYTLPETNGFILSE